MEFINFTPHDGPAPNTIFTASRIHGAFFILMEGYHIEKLDTYERPPKEHWLVRFARWLTRTRSK